MGYILVDHSQSLPSVQAIYGKKKEWDCVACKHCGGVIKLVHRAPQGAYCTKCAGPVHDTQKCASYCIPEKKRQDAFKAAIDLRLSQQKFLQRLGVEL